MYQLETYEVTHQKPCPEESLVCCSDHFFILDHCFRKLNIENLFFFNFNP